MGRGARKTAVQKPCPFIRTSLSSSFTPRRSFRSMIVPSVVCPGATVTFASSDPEIVSLSVPPLSLSAFFKFSTPNPSCGRAHTCMYSSVFVYMQVDTWVRSCKSVYICIDSKYHILCLNSIYFRLVVQSSLSSHFVSLSSQLSAFVGTFQCIMYSVE